MAKISRTLLPPLMGNLANLRTALSGGCLLLEIYFTLRGRWYLGPEKSLALLRDESPAHFEVFQKAFAPGASMADIQSAVGNSEFDPPVADRRAWNAGLKVGAKRALKPKQVWAIRFFRDQHSRVRNRELLDLALDSKLCGCDVVGIKIGDVVSGGHLRSRAILVQRKTGRPVQFELLADARNSLLAWSGAVAH